MEQVVHNITKLSEAGSEIYNRMLALEARVEKHSERIVQAETQLGQAATTPPPKPLAARLAAVMAAARRVPKTERHPHHGYMYAGVESIVEQVNETLSSEGVILIPRVLRFENAPVGKMTRTTVWMEYTFDCGHEATAPIPWVAWADDTSDKGMAKALTSARKTFLRDFFLITIGDERELDPDRNPDSGQGASPAPAQRRHGQRPPAAPAAAQEAAQTPPPADPVKVAAAEAVKLAANAAGLVNANGTASKALLEVVASIAVPDKNGQMTPAQRDRFFDALEWVKAARLGSEYDGKLINEQGEFPYVEPEDVTDAETLAQVLGDWAASQQAGD
jgi:hypothetical protein